MSNYKRYTISEDIAILKEIQKHPENLSKCFLTLEHKLQGRTASNISAHWYQVLSKKPSTKAYFFTGGPKCLYKNKKNITANSSATGVQPSNGFMKRLYNIINNLFNK